MPYIILSIFTLIINWREFVINKKKSLISQYPAGIPTRTHLVWKSGSIVIFLIIIIISIGWSTTPPEWWKLYLKYIYTNYQHTPGLNRTLFLNVIYSSPALFLSFINLFSSFVFYFSHVWYTMVKNGGK